MRTIFPAAEKIYDMKKIIILIVCVLSACFAAAQEPVPVLTLGTFHFDFPNLDQVQYAESEQIDVLNPVYQNEIETLVGLLEKFAPTIIVIERPVKMQFETDSLFRRYLADCYDLQRGEDEQIGFRLAKRLGIDRIYCVDEWGKHYDEIDELLRDENSKEYIRFETSFYDHPDSIKRFVPEAVFKEQGIIAELIELNDPEHIRRSLGNYLIGHFKYEF